MLCYMIAVLALPNHGADMMKLLCAKLHQSGKKTSTFQVQDGNYFLE